MTLRGSIRLKKYTIQEIIMNAMTIPIQVLIFVFSLSLYVALVSKILPLFLLKAKYKVQKLKDRGLKKYTFDGGRAITYKPCGETGKYIKQYILLAHDGDKYIKCKFDKRVFSIKYDLVALNSDDKELNTIQICEPTVYSGNVDAVILPENTAYVCIVVKEVNGFVVSDTPKMHYSFGRAFSFALVTVLLTVTEYLTMRATVASVIESVLPFALPATAGLPLVQMLISALVGAVLSGIILLLHRQKDVKIF